MVPLIWRDAIQHGIPIYEKSKKEQLAKRICNGDRQAREQVALSFMLYCEKLAYKYSCIYKGIQTRIEHDDLMQIGMLAVLENIDQAVKKHDDPFPYLVVAVRHEMANYCRFQSGLIRIPETHDRAGNAVHSPMECSYIGEDEENTPILPSMQQPRDYSTLYQAIEKLKGRTKEVICRRYGLNGYASESLPAISMIISDGKSKEMAGSYQAQALKQLRRHLTQL